MSKAIVFDLGGTLMEYAGMPLNWNDYYICGFKKLNAVLKLNLSENDLQESANRLKSYNPRISKREYEIKPEFIFNDILSNWGEKPDTNKVIEIFFESLSLKANIYEYSTELLKKCRTMGFQIACLTDLPNGMPDYIFKPTIEKILPYSDCNLMIFKGNISYYILLLESPLTFENTKFIAGELSLKISLVLYLLIGHYEP